MVVVWLHYAHDVMLGTALHYLRDVCWVLMEVCEVGRLMHASYNCNNKMYHLHLTSDIIVTLHHLILFFSHIDCFIEL